MGPKPQLNNMQEQLNSIEQKLEVLDEFRKKIDELIISVSFFNAKFEEQKKEIEEVRADFKRLSNENDALRTSMTALQNKIASSDLEIENIQAYSRRNNLEIVNIPETPGEDPDAVVKKLATVVGVSLNPGDIDVCHRIPIRNRAKTKPLLVKFSGQRSRNSFQKAMKAKKPQVKDIIPSSSSSVPIYANEHLTQEKKILLGKVTMHKKKEKAKYVWVKNNIIFYKRSDDSQAIKITKESDLSLIGYRETASQE